MFMFTKDAQKGIMVLESHDIEQFIQVGEQNDGALRELFLEIGHAAKKTQELFGNLSDVQKQLFDFQLSKIIGMKLTEPESKQGDYPDPEFLSTHEVSQLLGVSTQMVRRYCEDGKLVAHRLVENGSWRIESKQFKENEDIFNKYQILMISKGEKQKRTKRAFDQLAMIEKTDEYKKIIEERIE